MSGFIASEDEAAEGSSAQDASGAESNPEPPAILQDTEAQIQHGHSPAALGGTQPLTRLRKRTQPEEAIKDRPVHLALSPEAHEGLEQASAPGQLAETGHQRFTPEQKGKQKAVCAPEDWEEAGPSGLHAAAIHTPATGCTARRRRLHKPDGHIVKVSLGQIPYNYSVLDEASIRICEAPPLWMCMT